MPRPLGITARGLRLGPPVRPGAATAPPQPCLVSEAGHRIVTESGAAIAVETA